MIAIGSTETSIMIPITSDQFNEGNETFNLTLSNLTNSVFTGGVTSLVQEITIVDDEMPTLSFIGEPFSVVENLGQIEVTVALSVHKFKCIIYLRTH